MEWPKNYMTEGWDWVAPFKAALFQFKDRILQVFNSLKSDLRRQEQAADEIKRKLGINESLATIMEAEDEKTKETLVDMFRSVFGTSLDMADIAVMILAAVMVLLQVGLFAWIFSLGPVKAALAWILVSYIGGYAAFKRD